MKTAKKAVSVILTLVLALSCFAVAGSAESSQPLPTEPGSVLTSGTYTVSNTVTISAPVFSSASALEIAIAVPVGQANCVE